MYEDFIMVTVVRYRFGLSCDCGPDETDDSRTGERRFYRRLPRPSDARSRSPAAIGRVSFLAPDVFPPDKTARNGKHESHAIITCCLLFCDLRPFVACIRTPGHRRESVIPTARSARPSSTAAAASNAKNRSTIARRRPKREQQVHERRLRNRYSPGFSLRYRQSRFVCNLETVACSTIETSKPRQFQS